MGTPRPTILTDDLDLETRCWPKGVNRDYDSGSRYCFRVGKIDYVMWKWPWPEWIGIPNRENIDQWLDLIGYWKTTNTGYYNVDHVEKCISGLVRYV